MYIYRTYIPTCLSAACRDRSIDQPEKDDSRYPLCCIWETTNVNVVQHITLTNVAIRMAQGASLERAIGVDYGELILIVVY